MRTSVYFHHKQTLLCILLLWSRILPVWLNFSRFLSIEQLTILKFDTGILIGCHSKWTDTNSGDTD